MCLFDLGSVYWQLENWRKDLWELCHIGVPDEDKESKDSIVFGNLIYWFLKEVGLDAFCLFFGGSKFWRAKWEGFKLCSPHSVLKAICGGCIINPTNGLRMSVGK